MRATTVSNTVRSTRIRDAAEQVCPAFWMPALTRNGSAASRSASANTICGLLPPSSSVTGMVFFAAAAWISRPTATDPVNDRCRTPGCDDSAAPASSPRPGTTPMHNLRTERFFKPQMINGRMANQDGPIKTFPLRGIKDSPPYLHDGRLLTLEDTVEFFNLILETKLTKQEKEDLVA